MRRTSSEQATTLLDTTVTGQPWQPHLQLGAGVDAVTGQLRASAVKPFEVSTKGSLQPAYQYSFVQSESDVQSLVSASLKASYNLDGVTVSGSTSFLEELAVSDLSVTLVAEASVQQSRYSLAPTYELAVKPGPDFREKYGDYFVAGYRGGSSLYVVYQCRFATSEQRIEFAAALGADVPQVLSAEGSTAFEKVAKEHSANISVRIRAQGVSTAIPDPPTSGWTADSVISVLLPWFNSSRDMEPLESYLQAYRLIDPTLSGEVPVGPDVFAQLGYLYNRFWVARAYVRTCPDFGRRPIEDRYARLQKTVEANQASLATDEPRIALLTGETQRLLDDLHEVANRQSFYTQVVAAAGSEPPARQDQEARDGRSRWGYGFQQGNAPGVVVTATSQRVTAPWRLGHNEHVFSFRDSSRVIVGWDVVSNWADGTGGWWHKLGETVVGRTGGDVFVSSRLTRGYDWTVTWYTVDASLYPVGPWTPEAVHRPADAGRVGGDAPGEDPPALWTRERMLAATPVPPLVDTTPPLPDVERSVVGSRTEGATTVRLGDPVTTRVPDPRRPPHRAVGKLFFQRGGNDHEATAFVVAGSGIMTAAHCLFFEGQTATDIVFVPAYDDGHAPYGMWRAWDPRVSPPWPGEHRPAWDVGFCRVRPQHDAEGHEVTVGEVVGRLELQVDAVAPRWDDTGYPCKPRDGFPFDGRHQWSSVGDRVAWASPSTLAKEGDASPGSSGGPWLVPGTSHANGLHSADGPQSRTYVGPEFAPWVRDFYREMFG